MIFADAHMNPDQVSPMFRRACEYANYYREPMYSAGDFIQGLPHGYAKWHGCRCVGQVKELLSFYELYLVLLWGNHDPPDLLKALFDDCPYVTVKEKVNIPHADKIYNVQHGHRFGPLWSWLQFLAPPFVNFMARHYPEEWYNFSKARGWIPSQIENESDYHAVVLSLIAVGLDYVNSHDCRIVMGHAHKKVGVTEGDGYVLMIPSPLDTGCFITKGFQFDNLRTV